ncbi:hypothetical protein LSUE1_G006077 [Lachnellula suecica]|uniref:BZIP domain-containing protein n=1 Tax=Lachnellula suecica TaxID=602035 RepID=A0A8T9C3D5_9HELO|nr:hypothetical protein LSUE1_G006077 [Lachnellula suecica]
MSSTRSSTSPAAMEAIEEEPRKKGSRGGKRSVTHLSKAQLARKRANDREAQRNIRQRTKEHIENLEKKVKELEDHNRSSSMDRVVKRNKELEAEVANLRAQIASHAHAQASPISPDGITVEMPDDLSIPRKGSLDWAPDPCAWPPSHIPALDSQADIPVSNGAYTSNPSQIYPTAATAMGYDNEETEASQQLYTPTAIPVWEDPTVFGNSAAALSQSTSTWAPFHPAFNKPSRFADLQPSGFTDILSHPSFTNSTCWQAQPSIYAWQISTKLKSPVTFVDQLMFSVIHSQRHLALNGDLSANEMNAYPSVHLLFNQPGPAKPPSTLTEVMARYSAILSNRGFALIPEKLASFMCMYRFVQWQISPTYQSYQKLHDWQAPRPSQLVIPHPAWMDLPPWGKFREKVIENQERYDTREFQNDYATNLSVNFPHDPMKALIFEEGKIVVSPLMDRHLSDISNMSMKKPFADKYPEFRDVCRFDEV